MASVVTWESPHLRQGFRPPQADRLHPSPIATTVNETVRALWESVWLPPYPRATDDFRDGVYRMPREKALAKAHIQVNTRGTLRVFVCDIDHPDAGLRAYQCPALPNLIIHNRSNGHAHAAWILQEPVTTSERGRDKPKRFASAVGEGLRRSVDGDPRYVGLLMKNPCSDHWLVEPTVRMDRLWTLPDLANALGAEYMTAKNGHRPPLPDNDDAERHGRNCDVFDSTRRWAYKAAPAYRGNPAGFTNAVHAHVAALNAELPVPLPQNECRTIARSVASWIVNKSNVWAGRGTPSDAFRARQTKNSRKRREWYEDLIASQPSD